jgi:hypothetical protein
MVVRTFYITEKKYKYHLRQIAEMAEEDSDAFANKKLRTTSSVYYGQNTIYAVHYSATCSALSASAAIL